MNQVLMRVLAVLAFAFCHGVATAQQSLDEAIADLGHGWAKAYYQLPERDKDGAFATLSEAAGTLAKQFPGRAEPMVWQAIILSSHAKAVGGLGALSKVKQARELLMAAGKIDPRALGGSVYTSLGSLYAKVPGWPIGFGDKDKARASLEIALGMNPRGIDANYFYADFLADQGEYAKAAEHLRIAEAADPRPGREDADAGRRKEIAQLMSSIQEKLNRQDKVASAR